jgi:hypothetical protein
MVTGAGGPAAVSVMKSLSADPSVTLIAADMDPWAAGLYLVPPDARTLVPAGLDPGFADEAGVRLVASTDSHDCRDVGVYSSVRRIVDGAFSSTAA